MLLVGYLFGIRSERRLCEEVHQPRLSLVLPARFGRPGAGPLHLLQEPAWPVPRLRPASPTVRAGRRAVRSGRTGSGARLSGGRQHDHGRRQPREEAEGGRRPRRAPCRGKHIATRRRISGGARRRVAPRSRRTCDRQSDQHLADRPAGGAHLQARTGALRIRHQPPARPRYRQHPRCGRDAGALSSEVAATRILVSHVGTTLGITPESLAADKAYGSGPLLVLLIDRKITPYIPVIDVPLRCRPPCRERVIG